MTQREDDQKPLLGAADSSDTESIAEQQLLDPVSDASGMVANHGHIVITTDTIDTTNTDMAATPKRSTRIKRAVRRFFVRVGRTFLCIRREPYGSTYDVSEELLPGNDVPIEEGNDVDWIPENIRDRHIVPSHLLYECVDVLIIHHINDLSHVMQYKTEIDARNIRVDGRQLNVKILATIAVSQVFDQIEIGVSISTCAFVFITTNFQSDKVTRFMTHNVLARLLSESNEVGRLVPVYTSRDIHRVREFASIRMLSYYPEASEFDRDRHYRAIGNIFDPKWKDITRVRADNERRLNEARNAWIAQAEQTQRQDLYMDD